MFTFTTISAILAFSSFAVALVIPRATAPSHYDTQLLEPYSTYHTRYLSLDCEAKHETPFFDSCCHPLLATESVLSRPAVCQQSSSTDAPAKSSDENTATKSIAATPETTKATSTFRGAAIEATQVPASASTSTQANTGGIATFFFQNGIAGACGNVHQDSDFVAAIDADRYGDTGAKSPLCGKFVTITNTQNKKSVKVQIADACPTCENGNSIDLSTAAFKQIGTTEQGEVPISWVFD